GLVSAVCGPLIGRLGARYGHGRVLAALLGVACIGMVAQAMAADFPTLLVTRGLVGAVQGGLSPLIISVLAVATPASQRASVLSLTLFPGNLSFLVSGVAGSALAALGIRTVFVASSAVLALAGILTARST